MDRHNRKTKVRMRQTSHQSHLRFSVFDEMAQQSDDNYFAKAVNHGTTATAWGKCFFKKDIRHRLKGLGFLQRHHHHVR